jgi:hypothetical protein
MLRHAELVSLIKHIRATIKQTTSKNIIADIAGLVLNHPVVTGWLI